VAAAEGNIRQACSQSRNHRLVWRLVGWAQEAWVGQSLILLCMMMVVEVACLLKSMVAHLLGCQHCCLGYQPVDRCCAFDD